MVGTRNSRALSGVKSAPPRPKTGPVSYHRAEWRNRRPTCRRRNNSGTTLRNPDAEGGRGASPSNYGRTVFVSSRASAGARGSRAARSRREGLEPSPAGWAPGDLSSVSIRQKWASQPALSTGILGRRSGTGRPKTTIDRATDSSLAPVAALGPCGTRYAVQTWSRRDMA